ncbi:MAG TPA: hypothetical protein VM328_02800, partial [Fimbriimonadaceae bacterium]|nr:hypothetical protein [Fimbriimonadaceae bacterium]
MLPALLLSLVLNDQVLQSLSDLTGLKPDHPALPPSIATERPLSNGTFVRINMEFIDRGSRVLPDTNAYEYRCGRPCRGRVHSDHENCDPSCDGDHEPYLESSSLWVYPSTESRPLGPELAEMLPGEYASGGATSVELRLFRER